MSTKDIIRILKVGGIGVLPTDTLYGLVGSALSKQVVARIYKVRRRHPKKPLIVLIGSFDDLNKLGIKVDKRTLSFLKKTWSFGPAQDKPVPVSVILPCPAKNFSYLHRGTKTLAVRMPATSWLRNLLRKTGPLVAPSANLENRPPALTIGQAKNYFGNKIDFYFNGGRRSSPPSLLIQIQR